MFPKAVMQIFIFVYRQCRRDIKVLLFGPLRIDAGTNAGSIPYFGSEFAF